METSVALGILIGAGVVGLVIAVLKAGFWAYRISSRIESIEFDLKWISRELSRLNKKAKSDDSRRIEFDDLVVDVVRMLNTRVKKLEVLFDLLISEFEAETEIEKGEEEEEKEKSQEETVKGELDDSQKGESSDDTKVV